MKSAALVGVTHAHQYPGHPQGRADLFGLFVKRHAQSAQPDLIAEEMSREALAIAKVPHSSVENAAGSLRIKHLLCDPDAVERKVLGIPSYAELKAARGIRHVFEAEEALLKADERSFWPIREREWLNRLARVNHQSVFFVLGPDHVDSFAMLLQEAEYQVDIVSRRWAG